MRITHHRIPAADHPVYNWIGRIAAGSSHLDNALDLMIWDLLGVSQAKGACVTAQMLGAPTG